MITRDPLRVPCLTPRYYTTFPTLAASVLADALDRVRKNSLARPLPQVTGLSHEAQVELEEEHNVRSLKWAQSQTR